MSDIVPHLSIDDSHIRREWHDDEWYYAIRDVLALLLETNGANAKIYYTSLKHRLLRHQPHQIRIVGLKVCSGDGKQYLTDMTNIKGVLFIEKYLSYHRDMGVNLKNNRKESEWTNFQPAVIRYLHTTGWNIQELCKITIGICH
jgi:hypothetical protein